MARIGVQLLGPFALTRDGEPVTPPASRKARALLAYLSLAERPLSRAHLAELLWATAEDPRGSVRWGLSQLRQLLDTPDRRVVLADRRSAKLALERGEVDGLAVRAAAAEGLEGVNTEALVGLAGAFRGDALEDMDLPDLYDFQVWKMAIREEFRGLRVQILRLLTDRLTGEPERAVVHARQLTVLEPDKPTNHNRLVQLLRAAGRSAEADEQIGMSRLRLAEVGPDAVRAFRLGGKPSRQPAATIDPQSRQVVRFATASDGTAIAFAEVGQGRPLVKTANWLTHLEHDWKSPMWRHLATELATTHRLVRYDQRGSGLSDRAVADLGLDAQVSDLEAVVDAMELESFALLGISQGCRVATTYALRHPDRVSHLVLYGGAPRGFEHRPASKRATRQALQELILEGWGQASNTFHQVFTTLLMPRAEPEQVTWFIDLQRISTTPENAARIMRAGADLDLTPDLARVKPPTLVLHAQGDAMVPFEEGRRFAAGIPGARFVALDSENHILLEDEPAFDRFLQELRAFLAQPPSG